MAVQAVDGVTTNPAAGVEEATPTDNGKKDYSKMTAKEIIEADKNGETVPAEMLTWAKENPDSKTTYGESQGNATPTTENDAVAYQASLEEQGMSLKEQCKQFTQLSADKEVRDLGNVTKMAPYTQQVPTDETSGNTGESEVTKVLSSIVKDMIKSFNPFGKNTNFKEGAKFFDALKQGTSNELIDINASLEEMQAVIDGSLSDAKDSKQYGQETISLGKELKSHTKWWQFKGSRRKAAKNAIAQGDKTVKMSDRTDKLAQAIAKDNQVALKSVDANIKTVEEAEVDANGNPIESPTPTGEPPKTGGSSGAAPTA